MQKLLLLDQDNCAAGELWPSPLGVWRPARRMIMAELLRICEQASVAMCALTNRPPAQLGLLSAIYGGAFHLCESGLSAWIPSENFLRINPQYIDYAENIRPQIITRLQQHFQLSCHSPYVEEAGAKIVAVCVFPLPKYANQPGILSVAQMAAKVRELLADLPVRVVVGGGVDIYPKEANKAVALQWLPALVEEFYGDFAAFEVLYIDDNIHPEAAAVAQQLGIQLGAPANAAEETKSLLQQSGGWLAEAPFEAGCLQLVRRWLGI